VDFWTFVLILVVGGPIAQAVARRISRPHRPSDKALLEALEQTEQRLDDTEQRLMDNLDRMAEMEERLDFTERLLARQNSREQLGP
jgi:uncharacterized membrane-anchored protein YhcB (DUF1043 family)